MTTMDWRLAADKTPQARQLTTDFGLSPAVAAVLANRGIAPEQVESFLHPKLQDLGDPFVIPGMDAAAARLWEAVGERQSILVHGDYDADGITATALLSWVLTASGAQVECYLPHRINDGYGLTTESIDKAVAEKHQLLVTVDCGITSYEAAQMARERGLDLIITDHHEPGEQAPEALAVVNPKLYAEIEPLHSLAGVGVAFKLCHAFLKYGRQNDLGGLEVDLREGMDLVALGTVADIVPLLGENRCLVRHGLGVLASQRRPGVRALCDIAGLQEHLTATDIAYRLAPRLNAAGRMGDAEEALGLLQTEQIVDAYAMARGLDSHNRDRQAEEEKVHRAALDQIAATDPAQRFTIVVKGEGWHRGVIGIVASRLTHAYHRPSVVFSIGEDGVLQGSARGIEGVNLIQAFDACCDHLLRYGGHPMACGLALGADHLEAFEASFENAVRDLCGDVSVMRRTLALEGDATLGELDDKLFAELELLQPFGHGHASPVFRFSGVRAEQVAPAGKDHARGALTDGSGNGIAFIAFGRTCESLPDLPWDVAAEPRINHYRGRETPQLQVRDVKSAQTGQGR